MSLSLHLIFYLPLVISVRRQTRSSRITRARDFWPMGRQYISSDDRSLSFSTNSSSVHTPLFVCSHLWLIHGLCALPALNSVPIYSGRQSLSFCRFCQLRILLRFSPNTTLVPSDSNFSLVPSCSHKSPLLSHLHTAPCAPCSTPARTPDQRRLYFR